MTRDSIQMLVEMPVMLGSIVTKRGRVLRDGGSKGVSTLMKSKEKLWVATNVACSAKASETQTANNSPSSGDKWDSAHAVSAKLNSEFGKSIYVEPEGAGRFHELVSPPIDPYTSHAGGLSHPHSAGFGSPFGSPSHRTTGPGIINAGGIGAGMFGLNTGMAGRGFSEPLAAARPYWPSADNFMQRPEADLMSQFGDESSASNNELGGRKNKLKFSALRAARGWSELSEATQLMFEVEAAQLMSNGFQAQLGTEVVDEYSALVVLGLQPGISKTLRKFVEQATAGAQVQ